MTLVKPRSLGVSIEGAVCSPIDCLGFEALRSVGLSDLPHVINSDGNCAAPPTAKYRVWALFNVHLEWQAGLGKDAYADMKFMSEEMFDALQHEMLGHPEMQFKLR